MTVLLQAGDPGSLGNQNVSQGEFREQINAINDSIRQMGGLGVINPGDAVVNDPFNTPYIIYVNQDIGKDTFVFRDPYDYSTQAGLPAGVEEDCMKRISQQRLVAGYTESRPFKTLNRAIIETAFITSRDYFAGDVCAQERTRVTICVTGEILVFNEESPNDACEDYFSTPFVPGADHLYEPVNITLESGQEVSELMYWNPSSGGMLLPRGVSVVSLDLRKSIIRPHYCPCPAKEASDQSNRRAIFKVTGEGYYYGFTFMDRPGATESHHLLDCFQFSTKAELDDFYLKVKNKFGGQVPFAEDYIQTSSTESQIVGPNPDSGSTQATDTTASASPYVYNCSIRSEYGLCGIFCDGNRVTGFKSLVTAQFTGVSLQTDINCWEKYDPSGTNPTWWTFIDDYTDYISQSPDDVRQKPGYRSFHIRATNKAVIQEVSVFAIGQGIHHWVDNGAEITITNSNSNFGGAAALAQGYNPSVAATDGPWTATQIHRALDPFEKSKSAKTFPIGVVSDAMSDGGSVLVLAEDLFESQAYPGQPDVIRKLGYTLKGGDFIWVRNRYGSDYRARLAQDPWDPARPAEIKLRRAMRTDIDSELKLPGSDPDGDFPSLAGSQVYIRRFIDIRDKRQRSWWITLQGCDGSLRVPYRDYILRDVNDRWAKDNLPAVARTKRDLTNDCGKVEVILRDANSGLARSGHLEGVYYRRGDSVRRQGKHWVAVEDHMGKWDPDKWNEGYVHMEDYFVPEGQILNESPKIIFDGDTDQNEKTENCGFSIDDDFVEAQYQSATDYKGLANYLKVNSEVTCELKPQPADSQDQDISPDETINFHRPSNIRMFNHAWEWAGYLNYSKALPKYQQQISPTNKWTYYFTNQNGGKCYVSGFNEEGFQVTAKGLIDLATGDEIAGIDIGTPEEDIDRGGEDTEILDAKTRRQDLGDRGDPPFPSGIVYLADAETANPDLKRRNDDSVAELNNAIENDQGVVTPPFLNEWAAYNRFIRAPKQGVDVVVIHVVPTGLYLDAEKGANSVPFGLPADEDAGTRITADKYRETGSCKTLTEALDVAARIYVPTGAEVVISLHGDLDDIEAGPLQLINSYARVNIASARGLTEPAIITLDRNETQNALQRFPQFKDDYAYSAGVVFSDVHVKVNNHNRTCYLTFNGGIGMGKQGFKCEIDELAGFMICNASFGEGTSFFVYADAKRDQEVRMDLIVNSIGEGSQGYTNRPYLCVFGNVGGPNEDVGSGLTGHGVDITIDFRNAGYGDDANTKIVWGFIQKATQFANPPILCFLNLGGRGGCRAGGRVAPVIDLDFGSDEGSRWDLSWWIGKRWLENQNYFGRHFRTRETEDLGFLATYKMTQATFDSFRDHTLTKGSCIDIEVEDRFLCGPFCLFKEKEIELGDDFVSLTCVPENGGYIHGGHKSRRIAALYNESDFPKDPEANKDTY